MENYKLLKDTKKKFESIIKDLKLEAVNEKSNFNTECDAAYKYGLITAYKNIEELMIILLDDGIKYYYDKEKSSPICPEL